MPLVWESQQSQKKQEKFEKYFNKTEMANQATVYH